MAIGRGLRLETRDGPLRDWLGALLLCFVALGPYQGQHHLKPDLSPWFLVGNERMDPCDSPS